MSYEKIIADNKAWIDEVWAKLDEKLSRTAVKSRDKIPYTTKGGVHDSRTEGKDIIWWTNGFWGALMWVMYAGTKKECYLETGKSAEKIMDAGFNYMDSLHHDVGFMWHIMSGAQYQLTGDMASRNRDLLAAMTLASRYNVEGDYIRSWNSKWTENGNQGWTIIDCMMNIPQLYWASEQLDDTRFKKIAMRYADMAMRDHVRADGSVNHIVVHDTENPGVVIETKGGQGYGVGSTWSRGAAWALYGFILSYIHTKEQKYLDTAKKVAHYFITNVMNTDWLPLCDFRAPESPVIYDSTAGAIAACGIIEIAKNVPEFEKDMYLNAAIKMLKAMEKNWCNWNEDEDAILMKGTERWIDAPDGEKGKHIPIIYGDFFFAEAILKLTGSDFLPW